MVSETDPKSLRPSSINFLCKVKGLKSQSADFNMVIIKVLLYDYQAPKNSRLLYLHYMYT